MAKSSLPSTFWINARGLKLDAIAFRLDLGFLLDAAHAVLRLTSQVSDLQTHLSSLHVLQASFPSRVFEVGSKPSTLTPTHLRRAEAPKEPEKACNAANAQLSPTQRRQRSWNHLCSKGGALAGLRKKTPSALLGPAGPGVALTEHSWNP